MIKPEVEEWFRNVGHWEPRHDLKKLRRGIQAGLLNIQDEYGYTALMWACFSGWVEGIEELLKAGADIEIRDYRTGCTALYELVQRKSDDLIPLLVAAGANPDTPNYWGVTPRRWAPERFKDIPQREVPAPEPRIQNAEHLADHYHDHFEIPSRRERETLKPAQAVDLYVYGPKTRGKQDTVKVRITSRDRMADGAISYTGKVETPIRKTHLASGTKMLKFGPENVATVYVPKPKGKAP
jgi:hypothetical protein